MQQWLMGNKLFLNAMKTLPMLILQTEAYDIEESRSENFTQN